MLTKGTPMPVSEQKLEEFRASITQTKDLLTEFLRSHAEVLKEDPVIRFQLWRLRNELAAIDLDWSSEQEP